MNFRRIFALAPVAAVLCLATAGAQAVIVDIDAQSSSGTTVTLGAGTYTVTWAGIAGGGRYDAWQFNDAASGNFRNSFSVSLGSNVRTYDSNDGNVDFNSYATAAAALADFRAPAGQLMEYNGTGRNASATGNIVPSPYTVTFSAPTTLTFSVPDEMLRDNQGGVSLAITAAVPEPGTYALLLAGLGAVGAVARRRGTQPRG